MSFSKWSRIEWVIAKWSRIEWVISKWSRIEWVIPKWSRIQLFTFFCNILFHSNICNVHTFWTLWNMHVAKNIIERSSVSHKCRLKSHFSWPQEMLACIMLLLEYWLPKMQSTNRCLAWAMLFLNGSEQPLILSISFTSRNKLSARDRVAAKWHKHAVVN